MSQFLLSGLTQTTTITQPTGRIMAGTLDFFLAKQVHSLDYQRKLKQMVNSMSLDLTVHQGPAEDVTYDKYTAEEVPLMVNIFCTG